MEVLEAAKISYRQLDYWTRQRYIDLDGPGSGRQREYTRAQLEHVVAMADLVRAGLLPDLAHQVVDAEEAGRPNMIGCRQLMPLDALLDLPSRPTEKGASMLCACGRWVRVTKAHRLPRHNAPEGEPCLASGRRVRK